MARPNRLECPRCRRAALTHYCHCTGKPVERVDLRVRQLLVAIFTPSARQHHPLKIYTPK